MNSGGPPIAIVTGAGKRVGAEIAQALVADGWAVVAHVRRDSDAVPDGALKAVADLGQADCAEKIFAAASELGRPSLLVNNAARFAFDELQGFGAEEFDAHMAVNVRAPALLAERFASGHVQGHDAMIVNLLDAKIAAPNPDFLSYTLSKVALGAFTELAAQALAGQGIRVNGIAPALMLRSSGQSEENFAAMHACNPLGRAVRPNDVVRALRYLIDADTVTGQILTIDGGQRFMRLERDVQFLG